uniref:GPI ethanolamine phosphate transferase 3 n=1 Tax=Wuchereria bancrofti TaxID=6293 RepID=A0AAF5PG04_WUCBA
MKRSLAKRSNEQRLLRPRLEVKEEEGFDRSDVKKALLESLYEQRKEERRKELAKELKRRENYSRNRLIEKDQKRSKNNEHNICGSGGKKQSENSKLKRKKEKRGVEQHTSKDKNLLKGKEKVKIQENLVVKNKDAVVVVKSKEKIKVSEVRITDQEEKRDEIISEEAKIVIEKVEHKKVKKDFDIEALPSTRDFVRFMSLDYSDDLEGIPKELQHFRTLPLVPVPELPCSCSDVVSHDACWFPSQYQRVVIILIDALRYDFVAPSRSQYNDSKKEYSGHFSTITRLLNDHKESAVLMHFRADAPTTTMQRLKAITTGSLPTFIDVSSNFASTAILEDNWIDEIVATNRSIVMLGDDTWISLYPKQFKRKYHLPSFDINDLHTVDQMISDNLFDELVKSDWTVLIAHFLGVDHCGHKYGPNHPEMSKKLKQMNEILAKVVDSLDNNTLLLVMGDHGMTENGDHGGDEPLETDAALFLFAKRKLIFAEPPESVSQVDIVPTISLLLDSPIPYSNIGTLIDCTIVPEHRDLAISSNVEQMMRYGRTIVAETQLPELDSLIRSFENNGNVENSIDYMRRLQELLRASWTEFNSSFMRIGFLSLLDAILSVYDSLCTGNISFTSLVFRSGLFFIQISIFLIGDDEYYVAILDFLLSFSLIIRLVRAARTLFLFTSTIWEFAVFCMIIAHASSFLSNSYIIFESSVIRFLTQTVVAIAFWQSFSNWNHNTRRQSKSFLALLEKRFSWQRFLIFIMIILLLRLGIFFEKCREEQGDACEATIFSQSFSHIPHSPLKIIRFMFGIAVQIVAAYMATKFLQNYPSEIWTSTLIFPTTVASIASWLSLWLPENTTNYFAPFSLGTAQPTFSSIPWQAAFIGVPGNFAIQIVPGALVIAHIFASQIITCVALPMLVMQQNYQQSGLSHWTYKLILFHSLKALSVCIMAAIHRRHLMVWKIFAPKFIFESLSLCVVCFTLLITNCIFWKLVVPPSLDLTVKRD